MIDPDFGTEEDLKNLIKKAKDRGMKIMLDGVFSHTGDDSLYFNKYGSYPTLGAYAGKDSPYYKWYTFRSYPDDYECWWGINTLPNVVETEETYNDYINGENGIIAKYTKMGIGGWRLDVADELPDIFLQNLAKRVKTINPKAIVLGEVWEDAVTKVAYSVRRKYFWGRELESVTNYPFKADILEFIQNGDAQRLNRTVISLIDHYPKEVTDSLMNMIGTHDTVRALTALSTDKVPASRDERATKLISDRDLAIKKLKLSAVLQYTLPGVPLVFYGDEAGLEGYEDPFNRRCYPWGKEDKNLIEFFRVLGKIRKDLISVLADGTYAPVTAKNGLLIYERYNQNGTIKVIANAQKTEYVLDEIVHDEITNSDLKTLSPHSAIIIKC
jgi:glycosidase